MTDDNANLSIDFLVGFTIFILAFIWVVSIIPGLLIGLQSHTIDYDAVAYRTGVILVEDPGYPVYVDRSNLSWEEKLKVDKRDVDRLGLAISRDTPNILSQEKVNGFFHTSASYNTSAFTYSLGDYHKRAIFGDYPYRVNISLRDIDRNEIRSVGDVIPLNASYGYISRIVKIKEPSIATINNTTYIENPSYISTNNSTRHRFSILLNTTKLVLGEVKDPAYQINPVKEQIMINITDLNKTINQPVNITLSSLTVKRVGDTISYPFDELYIDDNSTPYLVLTPPGVEVINKVSLKFKPTFFDSIMSDAEGSQIYLTLTFDLTGNSTFLNNTPVTPFIYNSPNNFDYNYNPNIVRQPQLRPAILEVAVW
jgi:hypothetical protein